MTPRLKLLLLAMFVSVVKLQLGSVAGVTTGAHSIFERRFSERPVLMVYQKPETLNLMNNT